MGTVAIIGDVGGHAQQLIWCLNRLGVTSPDHLPEDLMIVQVGDLIGGVDDRTAVEIANNFLPTRRWVQLLGNWDSRVVGGCPFVSPTRGEPDPDAEDLFALWHHTGNAHHAVAVRTASGTTAVVTHAGVTQPFWRRWLGATSDPVEAVARINDLPLAVVHQPGRMLGFQEPAVDVDFGYDDIPDDDELVSVRPSNVPVGPIWADTTELWSSWLDTPSPWPQIHGHTSAWFRNDWSQHAPPAALPYAKRNRELRHTRYVTGRGEGFPLLGIDCSVWAAPNLVLHPLVIPNAQIVGIDPN